MNVELANTTGDFKSRRHVEVWTFLKAVVQMHEILTHDIIQHNDVGDPIQERKDPIQYVVHVPLSIMFR